MPPHTALARPPFDLNDKDVQYAQPTNSNPYSRANVDREARNKASESTYDAYVFSFVFRLAVPLVSPPILA